MLTDPTLAVAERGRVTCVPAGALASSLGLADVPIDFDEPAVLDSEDVTPWSSRPDGLVSVPATALANALGLLDPAPATAPSLWPELPPLPTERRTSPSWLRRHRRSLATLVVLIAAVAVVHTTGVTRFPGPRDDEGTYVAEAWALQHWNRLAHYTYSYDHPPLGWMFIALWSAVGGRLARVPSAVGVGRDAMLICQLASCALLFALSRRLGLSRVSAAVAVGLFSFAPVALLYHRLVYLDNVATPLLLGAFVLAASPRRHLAATVGSGMCFAAAVLTKETTLLLLPALGYQLWQRSDDRTRRMSLALFGATFVMTVAGYPLYALLKGEFFPGPGHVSLLGGAWWQLAGRQSSGSPLVPGTLARQQVQTWLSIDPWLLVSGLVAVPIALLVKALRPLALGVAILAMATLRGGYLPVPYVIGPLALIPVLVAGVADASFKAASSVARLAQRALAAVALVAIAGAAALVVPVWTKADANMLSGDESREFRDTEHWVVDMLPRSARVVVEDSYWVDLVHAGWAPERVIWFAKLDNDSAVMRTLPRGWRDTDYVILSPGMRSEARIRRLSTLQQIVSHSSVVASFGHGDPTVEIRRVNP